MESLKGPEKEPSEDLGFTNIEGERPESNYASGLLSKAIHIFNSISNISSGDKVFYDVESSTFSKSGEALREYKVTKLTSALFGKDVMKNLTTAMARKASGQSIDTTLDALRQVEGEVDVALEGIIDFVHLSDDMGEDQSEWINNAQQVLSKLQTFKESFTTSKIGMEHLSETYKSRDEDYSKLSGQIQTLKVHAKNLIENAQRMLENRLDELKRNAEQLKMQQEDIKIPEEIKREPVKEEEIAPISKDEIHEEKKEEITLRESLKKESVEETEKMIPEQKIFSEQEVEIPSKVVTQEKQKEESQAAIILEHFPQLSTTVPELNASIQPVKAQAIKAPTAQRGNTRIRKLNYLCKIADQILKTENITKIDDKLAAQQAEVKKREVALTSDSSNTRLRQELIGEQKKLQRLQLYKEAVDFAQERSLHAKKPLARQFINRLQSHADYVVLHHLTGS